MLEPDKYYHIFNRANGKERIFYSQENYRYFLRKYCHYISSIADTFCYCLMPNHFHFLIRIKSEKELSILPGFENLSKRETDFVSDNHPSRFRVGPVLESRNLSRQFSNLFNSYTKSLNKEQNRKGNLFMHSFKRKPVADEKYLRKLVHYLHFNPVEAGLSVTPGNWEHSSYPILISQNNTWLKRDEVIEWFNDVENFKYIHEAPPEVTGIDSF